AFLTSISATDLDYVQYLKFVDAPLLTSISLPQLQEVNRFSISLNDKVSPSTGVTLEIPLLFNATQVEIVGSFPRLDCPSLVEIAKSLYITSNRNLSSYNSPSPFATSPTSPGSSLIAVNMPVLTKARDIRVIGNIAELSMPSLATLKLTSDYDDSKYFIHNQLEIFANGEPLVVEFPSLWNVTDISLSGKLSMVSFPALETMYETFKLEPSINMTFDTKPLHRAEQITFAARGYIDCEPATAVWTRIHPSYAIRNYSSEYHCRQPYLEPEKPKKKFPTVAVGLSVGIGIPVWVFFMFSLWHSRKAKKKAGEIAKIPPPDYDAEMAARSAGGEVLPDYGPQRSQGSEVHPGSIIELVDMTRPSPHPPGYEAAIAATGGGSAAVPTVTGSAHTNAESVGDDRPRPRGRS
ncbi:hypothetical protein BKA65DRAFT_582340, partial [Rhexocercosporidium sp. MPI-PUGE-AT-0058]